MVEIPIHCASSERRLHGCYFASSVGRAGRPSLDRSSSRHGQKDANLGGTQTHKKDFAAVNDHWLMLANRRIAEFIRDLSKMPSTKNKEEARGGTETDVRRY